MDYTRCPYCGEQLLFDKVYDGIWLDTIRMRCVKCGFWESRCVRILRQVMPKEEDEHGLN